MAFSATVRNIQYYGPGRTTISGDWTGNAGDAAGTMAISGIVVSALFQKYTADSTYEILPRVTSTVASGITTLTIENQDNVTTGYWTVDKIG